MPLASGIRCHRISPPVREELASRRATRRRRRVAPRMCHVAFLITSRRRPQLALFFFSLPSCPSSSRAAAVAVPAISGRHSSISSTSTSLASSSTPPQARLSDSRPKSAPPRPPSLEALPHTSISILRPLPHQLSIG